MRNLLLYCMYLTVSIKVGPMTAKVQESYTAGEWLLCIFML